MFPLLPCLPERVGVCVILGSRNCGYRVRQAFSECERQSAGYVVAGGALMESGETEAAFMRARLLKLGVSELRIRMDESSFNTAEDLRHPLPLIEALANTDEVCNVVLVTGGFHVVRTMDLARRIIVGVGGCGFFRWRRTDPTRRRTAGI